MFFQCPRVEANFPTVGLRLENRAPVPLIWDEHGGTCVLRAAGLEVREAPDLRGEAGLRLEAALPAPAALTRLIEEFAGRLSLRLDSGPAEPALVEKPILAACHIPEKMLFIFCEEALLTMQRHDSHRLELAVAGAFKASRVPCQETDVVIHLELAAMGRLLGGLLAWARES